MTTPTVEESVAMTTTRKCRSMMGTQGRTKPCLHSAAILLHVLFLWAFCLNAATGEMFCPPAQANAAYNITSERYNLGNVSEIDITANWSSRSQVFAVCNLSSLQCSTPGPIITRTFLYQIKLLGDNGIQMTVGVPSFLPVLQNNYYVLWNIGGRLYNDSCAVAIGSPINECDTVIPCVNATRCTDQEIGYKCQCSTGFYGTNCNAGDHQLRCAFSKYELPIFQGGGKCVNINNNCSVAGLDYSTELGLRYSLLSNNGSSVLQVTPSTTDKAMLVTVCTTATTQVDTYQIMYQLQSNYSKTSYQMQVLVKVSESNTAPVFNWPLNGDPYVFNVTEGNRANRTVIVTVAKSVSRSCDYNSCIEVIDPDISSGFGISSLVLDVTLDDDWDSLDGGSGSGEPYGFNSTDEESLYFCENCGQSTAEDYQSVPILYQENGTRNAFGYFYLLGDLRPATTIKYSLKVTDGGQASASAKVVFNVLDVNEPPVCNTAPITASLDLRNEPGKVIGIVYCSDRDVDPRFQDIYYVIAGDHADYFEVDDHGHIALARAVVDLDPGILNLTVTATGYSAELNNNYTFHIQVIVNFTAPEPHCHLNVTRVPSVWRVNSEAELILECETWGLDKLKVVNWTHWDLFNVSLTKQSPTLVKIALTVTHYRFSSVDFEVEATLGGHSSTAVVNLPMFNTPVFTPNDYNISILETLSIGEQFLILNATVGDPPEYSLIYTIISDNSSSLFNVDSTGILSTTGKLQSLGGIVFSLVCEVKVYPGGLTATATVTISVLDVNEAPVCMNEDINIPSNVPPQSIITNVSCHDHDTLPEFRILSYSIVTEPSTVQMEIKSNGSLILTAALPAGTTNVYVRVNVSDGGGLSTESLINIAVREVTCPPETTRQFGLIFPETPVNSQVVIDCPSKHTGQITRSCYLNQTWGPFNYNNCSNEELGNINTAIANLLANVSQMSPKEVEEKLKAVAGNLASTINESSSVLPADIKQTVDIFNKVKDLTSLKDASLDDKTVKTLVSTANVLFDTDEETWKETNVDYEGGAIMMQALDSIVSAGLRDDQPVNATPFVTKHLEITTAVSSYNIAYTKDKQGTDENTIGPTLKPVTSVFLSKKAFNNAQDAVKYSVVLYKNLTDKLQINPKLQSGQLSGKMLNSDVLAFVVNVTLTTLLSPLQLNFSVLQTNYFKPSCGFLDTNARVAGVWSTAGCSTTQLGDTVQCSCNHLTNFAVLMSPNGDDISPLDKEALSIISAVGCGISMFCLVITIIVYVYLWKYVKGDRSVLHINLSVCLVAAYIVFLVGVDRTDNQVGCKVVAALLHYLFLAVFFIMLSEGIEIFKSVSFVFSSDSILCKLIPLSYGVPLIIVAVSLGVTRTEGYGSETSCWLSTKGGLIWAFVGPVLLVILINFFILVQVLRIMQRTRKMMEKPVQEKAKSVVRTICILSPLLGVTWVFGVLSVNKGTIIFQYLFAIFNSLQGLFIFICYCLLTPQVKDGFRSSMRKKRAKSFDTSQKMASSSSTGKFAVSRTDSSRVTNYSNSFSNTHTTSGQDSSFSEARTDSERYNRQNSRGSNDFYPTKMENALSHSDRSSSWHVIPLGNTDPSRRDSGQRFYVGNADPIRSNSTQSIQASNADAATRDSGQRFPLGSSYPITRDIGQNFFLGNTNPVRSNSVQIFPLGNKVPFKSNSGQIMPLGGQRSYQN